MIAKKPGMRTDITKVFHVLLLLLLCLPLFLRASKSSKKKTGKSLLEHSKKLKNLSKGSGSEDDPSNSSTTNLDFPINSDGNAKEEDEDLSSHSTISNHSPTLPPKAANSGTTIDPSGVDYFTLFMIVVPLIGLLIIFILLIVYYVRKTREQKETETVTKSRHDAIVRRRPTLPPPSEEYKNHTKDGGPEETVALQPFLLRTPVNKRISPFDKLDTQDTSLEYEEEWHSTGDSLFDTETVELPLRATPVISGTPEPSLQRPLNKDVE